MTDFVGWFTPTTPVAAAKAPCTRSTMVSDMIGGACGACGHTNLVHPGPQNPSVSACALCTIPVRKPVPARAPDPDRYWDREIYLIEEIGARSPGWFEASCVACYWHTTGSESVVKMAFEQHACQDYEVDRG